MNVLYHLKYYKTMLIKVAKLKKNVLQNTLISFVVNK